jgi:hypothetical protein
MKKYVIPVLCLTVSLFSFLPGNAKDASFYAPESKLLSGKWVKIRTSENAIYKLTYEYIQSLGINPAKAKVYGYGGWMLNQSFGVNDYSDDLPEVPVWLSGTDNTLHPGEFLLFYGKGHTKWTLPASSASSGEFKHENNPYSDYGYYFIGEKEGPLKVVENAVSETPGALTLNTFNDYALYERDLISIIPSGRELFGENFLSNTRQIFSVMVKEAVPGNVTAEFRFLTTAPTGTTVSMSVNGNTPVSQSFIALKSDNDNKAYSTEKKGSGTINESGKIDIAIEYSHSGYNAYLDYIRLFVKRYLRPDGAYTFFRNTSNLSNNCTYQIENVSPEMFVLELTESQEIKKIPTTTPASGVLSFHAVKSNPLREFVLVNPGGAFPVPEFAGHVDNQNLHALPQTDLVIITRPVYWEQAQRLAEKHASHSGLKVQVVTAEQTYNEFSSGTPDATAYRRLMKMFYDRAANENDKPKYLLLFGDGAYDNRMLTSNWNQVSPDNYLLTFQSINSIQHRNSSYASDDYFGYLEDTDGIVVSALTSSISGSLRLGIGRFPVKTVAEAEAVVSKVINYMDNKSPDTWKNRLIFLAGDDPDTKQWLTHVKQSETIAKFVDRTHPQYISNKIYYDAFKQSSSMGTATYPDAQRKLDKKLKEGVFLLNYVGHGAAGKIDKNMVTSSSIGRMSFTHLPLWITATCEFGRWDDVPTSAAEHVLLNPISGGIGLITSSRVVYSDKNALLDEALVRHLFEMQGGSYQRLGDIVRKAKNDLSKSSATADNTLTYVLLGDPALKLSYPGLTICIDSVNGRAAEDEIFQFKARDVVTLKGRILNVQGVQDTEFNGKIKATVMDAPREMSTLSTDSILKFNEYLSNLYEGTHKVVNGTFTLNFVVPVDISHSTQLGKMSLYAFNDSDNRDANGSFAQFFLKGVSEDGSLEMQSPPQIRSMFLNTPAFENGAVVNDKPYFSSEIYDEFGINISGMGIDHDIMLIIDNKPLYSYPLNEYFVKDEDDPRYGSIHFNIPDSLSPGNHTLTFKVWNILNISTSLDMSFVVEAGKAPVIYTLGANPNPAREDVNFVLHYDRPETDVDIKIFVFDLAGTLVWNSETTKSADLNGQTVQIQVPWNLISNAGNRVTPGVYLYKAIISSGSGKETSATKKLIILAP